MQKYSDSTKNLIQNLRETIQVRNKKKVPHSKKHRIILIGDNNIKGHASNLKSILSNNYEFYSITKPGSTTSELKESAKMEIRQLSHDDVINDYEMFNFDQTFLNIRNFVMTNNHTNIILMNIPHRYDIPNLISVNMNIASLNRKLQKLVNVLPLTTFIKMEEDRNLCTKHGLHLNKLGKQLVQHQIASHLHSIFEQKPLTQSSLDGMRNKETKTKPVMKTKFQLTRTKVEIGNHRLPDQRIFYGNFK